MPQLNAIADHARSRESCGAEFGPGVLVEGKYRLEGLLGEGAMGRVWLARNVTLDLPLAIKIVQPELHGREAMSRLLTEARVEAKLRHPNIVRVFDCQNDGANAYAVMELLEGCTLADLMAQGPLPATLAVRLMLPILSGLGTAHREGIVHRDIKPGNLFIARVGDRMCPKLLDFGIARLGVSGPTAVKSSRLQRSTRRMVMGSPGYMSPEQAWGDTDVDERTDLWAIGVVLYEAITGKDAFAASSYAEFLKVLVERELPPITGRGASALWAIMSRALVKSREDRIASTEEFSAALRGWLESMGIDEDLAGDTLPACWAPPGGLVARTLARTQEATLMSEPTALTHSAQAHASALPRTVRSQCRSELTDVPEPARVLDHSGVRTISARPAQRGHELRERAWMIACIVVLGLSALVMHTFEIGAARADASGRVREPRAIASVSRPVPPLRAAMHKPHSHTERPVTAAVVAPLAARVSAAEPALVASAAEPALVASSNHFSTAPRELRARNEPSPRRAPAHSQRSELDRQQQLRREAAALGLKSPW